MVTRRPRDLAATRSALLEAARRLFTERGYEGVGVRDIAEKAGADKALITRYFGCKEGLFAEAIPETIDPCVLLPDDRARFGEHVVRYLMDQTDGERFNPTVAMLRSVADPGAAELLRSGVEYHFVGPLATWLGGDDAQLRASILAAQIAGLELMINVLPLAAFAATDVEALIAKVGPLLQSALEAPGGEGAPQ
jgi:AcrR family transcriptional regulator